MANVDERTVGSPGAGVWPEPPGPGSPKLLGIAAEVSGLG